MKYIFYILSILFLISHSLNSFSQEDDLYEKLLEEEVEVENPVYMPVIGFGPGVLNYYGELDSYNSPLSGNGAMKINVSTFVDNNHFFKTNFFILLLGSLSAQQYDYNNPSQNMNFESEITAFGINLQYSFEHFIKPEKPIHPFISLGVELNQFNSKTDLALGDDTYYNYNEDGTIRDEQGNIIFRDYNYETDLRKEVDYGLGDYTQSNLAIPVEIGFNLSITDRSYLQVATSLHYMFTDVVDHISHENTEGMIGDKSNDMFTFNYVTFHYDLFSDDETMTIKKLFADIDFDPTMWGDEDYDMVLDRADKCPGTPEGVKVDSLGCPIDDDMDGVPNYLDLEKNTPKGAWVNESGQEVSLEDLMNVMNNDAVSREDVKAILRSSLSNKYYAAISNMEIPDKYKKLDSNEDGYLSFDELLDTLDKYFAGETDMNPDDLQELKDFFFSQ